MGAAACARGWSCRVVRVELGVGLAEPVWSIQTVRLAGYGVGSSGCACGMMRVASRVEFRCGCGGCVAADQILRLLNRA